MPTYALMGATGSTGSSVLRCLLDEVYEDVCVNILVRSKQKLIQQFPDLKVNTSSRISIVQGSSTDTNALSACLADADIILMCVGQNESVRGMSLVLDTAIATIETLSQHRKAGGTGPQERPPPLVIQLRTASMNPPLARQAPWLVRRIVSFCLRYSYEDLQRACDAYRSAASEGVLDYVFVDPPTLHDAGGMERTGHRLLVTFEEQKQGVALSYADLGAGICEVAARAGEFRGRAVGIAATGKVRFTWGVLAGYLAQGARGRVRDWMEDLFEGLHRGIWAQLLFGVVIITWALSVLP